MSTLAFERSAMKILYIAFCSLSASITFSGWMLGYVMAHNEISSECERLGKGGLHGAK